MNQTQSPITKNQVTNKLQQQEIPHKLRYLQSLCVNKQSKRIWKSLIFLKRILQNQFETINQVQHRLSLVYTDCEVKLFSLFIQEEDFNYLVIQYFPMQQIISQLQRIENYKLLLRETCKRNKINVKAIYGLTTNKIMKYYHRTLKHYASNPEKAKNTWFQNELRLFHWIIIIKSLLLAEAIKQFQNHHWQEIQQFFSLKPISMFKFEITKLITISSSESHRSWTQQECDLLTQIIKEGNIQNRWKDVSRLFYEKSGQRLYRCSKQCRQQWLNHLDSSKIQGQWSQDEDLKILQAVIQNGHKWAMISKDLLPTRTQHMIKNRFNSIIGKKRTRKQLRSYNERKIIRKLISRLKNKKDSVKSSPKNGQSAIKTVSEPSFGKNVIDVFHTQLALDDQNQREGQMEEQNEDLYISPMEQLSDKSPVLEYSNNFAYMNAHMFGVPQPMTAQMPSFVPSFFLVGNTYCGFTPTLFMGGF